MYTLWYLLVSENSGEHLNQLKVGSQRKHLTGTPVQQITQANATEHCALHMRVIRAIFNFLRQILKL